MAILQCQRHILLSWLINYGGNLLAALKGPLGERVHPFLSDLDVWKGLWSLQPSRQPARAGGDLATQGEWSSRMGAPGPLIALWSGWVSWR